MDMYSNQELIHETSKKPSDKNKYKKKIQKRKNKIIITYKDRKEGWLKIRAFHMI